MGDIAAEIVAEFERGRWACRGRIKRLHGGVPECPPGWDANSDLWDADEAYRVGWMLERAGVLREQWRARDVLEVFDD